MSEWSLTQVLHSLHEDIEQKLEIIRKTLNHPVSKGDASEGVWIELFTTYLPERYRAEKAFVVDSKGTFSQQIDVVIFDRQYSPFIFKFKGETIVPAESVYAVFEAKQSINAQQIEYAQNKAASVRALHRTSLPIPHAGGTFPPKSLIPIYAGILTFESDWKPAFGTPLSEALSVGKHGGQLDIGCVAAHGYFNLNKEKGVYENHVGGKPATAFLFKLIAQLQFSGTVPMIDIQAYAKWLSL
jgi:hypothetical protein